MGAFCLMSCSSNISSITEMHHTHTPRPYTEAKNPQKKNNFPTIDSQGYLSLGFVQPGDSALPGKAYDNDGEDLTYNYGKLPLELSLNFQSSTPIIGLGFGFGAQGYSFNLSTRFTKYLQLHGFINTWILGNHRLGYGLTSQPIPFLIIGASYYQINAYAVGCVGSCGLAAISQVLSSQQTYRSQIEARLDFTKAQVFIKSEYDIQYRFNSFGSGIAFKI